MTLNSHVLILAAGQGKRMHSKLPKVVHPLLFRPMVHYVLDAARAIPHESISLIVGHGEQTVRHACRDYVDLQYFQQKEQRGTAHAVKMAEPFLNGREGHVLVLAGDVPLLTAATLERVLQTHAEARAAATMLTARVPDPKGYGRVLRHSNGLIAGIREEADCSSEEKTIAEVNSGVYCFRIPELLKALDRISDSNRQGEYYLTDAIALLTEVSGGVHGVMLEDPTEMTGINDRRALAQVEKVLQRRTNEALMLKGVGMRDPDTVYVDPTCRIEPDVLIESGCQLIASTVRTGAVIEANCRISRSTIGERCHIKQGSYIEESEVEFDAAVGPYAHLRPGSRLGPEVKIGNFVEVKKSSFGRGSKASHLAYIGDAEVGADVNLGCGFITCNYDGVNKHKTIIEDGVFVGSDSQAVAPVRLGKGSYVASGTTITRDVPSDGLAISRVKQENKEGYAARLRERHKKKPS